jgi:hypothetical protein
MPQAIVQLVESSWTAIKEPDGNARRMRAMQTIDPSMGSPPDR